MSESSVDFAGSLEQVRELIQQDLTEIFSQYRQRARQTDQWSDWITEWIEAYCLVRGKAVRPWLVAVGAAASQNISLNEALQQEKVRRVMALIELTHYRLLMADDVADRDAQRHGHPSFHIAMQAWLDQQPQYQQASEEVKTHVARSYTEIAGVLLQQMASWQLFREPQVFSLSEISEIHNLFDHHEYLATAGGWFRLFDQSFQSLPDVSEEDFLRGLLLVTGHYTFIGPLSLGACLGERADELTPSIQEYGKIAGTLFQVTDDWLGLFGNPAETGKPVGNDIREGKKTLPFQAAYRVASSEQKQQLSEALRNENLSNKEVEQIQRLVRDLGGEQYSREKVTTLLQQGVKVLEAWPHQETQHQLVAVLNYLENRVA